MAKYQKTIREISKEVEADEKANVVEAQDVEIGESDEIYGVDMERCLQMIQRRHPEKHIAWVNQKDSKFKHNRWVWLKVSDGGEDVAEVNTMEEADMTTSNVLCWRDRKFQDAIDRRIHQLNIESVRRERMEHTSNGQAQKFNSLIGGTKGIKAKPLSDEAED
jgi:hypothetical protein